MPPLDDGQRASAVVLRVARRIRAAGGRAFVVGGYVRDQLLGLCSKDLDIEVFGIEADQLQNLLSSEGTVDTVGASFGVFMIHGIDIDWSLPRRDSKHGRGHRGIRVHTDPGLSYQEAARRRDLTMNAFMWDPLDGELLDPFGGREALHQGVLRAVDARLFSDDPLRALRVVRMATTFGFVPEPALLNLMREQDLSELSRERLWGEWEKIALKSRLPSLAFLSLEDSGLLRFFPELDALRDVQQDPEWHPEGDVYVHTAMVMDAAVALRSGEREHDLALMLGALCHDLGKADTTAFIDGHWRSRGHDQEGLRPTQQLLQRFQTPPRLVKQVEALVLEHLKPIALEKGGAGPAAYRRLARKCGERHVHLRLLAEVCEADHRGRTTDDATADAIPYLNNFYQRIDEMQLADSTPEPVVQGRHLLERGYQPGPGLGRLLKRCFDYQIESGCDDINAILEHLDL